MPSNDNQWRKDAEAMAARIERNRSVGEQLALLPDEVAEPEEARGVGRPKGAKNKASTQLRDYLAAQGMRMPEDVLTEIAGLRTREDAISLAIERSERILLWMFDGAHIGKRGAPKPTPSMRREVFGQQYTIILRAIEALMPYASAKVTPDMLVTNNTRVQVVVPPAPQAPEPRDVTPQQPRRTGRMVPADVAHEIEQKQQVSDVEFDASDSEGRTE